ncbi:hypothetical protein C8R43DRAFT_1120707 [Mycena crocata]|nr:hypothetical protein C8R43DRAFT_1120707 [Mycena crocata]
MPPGSLSLNAMIGLPPLPSPAKEPTRAPLPTDRPDPRRSTSPAPRLVSLCICTNVLQMICPTLAFAKSGRPEQLILLAGQQSSWVVPKKLQGKIDNDSAAPLTDFSLSISNSLLYKRNIPIRRNYPVMSRLMLDGFIKQFILNPDLDTYVRVDLQLLDAGPTVVVASPPAVPVNSGSGQDNNNND